MIARKAEIKDIDLICKLGEDKPAFQVTENTEFWTNEEINELIKSRTDLITILEEKDEIIGFSIITTHPHISRAMIENFYIKPSHRQKGAGNLLYNSIKKFLNEYKYLFLLAKDPIAIDFFKSKGYTLGKQFYWMDKEN